jgi:hypothetical protein
MANQTVSIFIRFKQDGKQLPAMAAAYAGKAQMRQEDILAGISSALRAILSHISCNAGLRD